MLGFNPNQQAKKQVLKKKGAGKDQQNSAPNLNAENPAIAGGGMIQGPGTGTSDDIQTQMPAGSYIMPADSTDQIGEEGLAGLGSPANVRVSNGEYQLPPEQVHAIGVQALDQMKDATHTPVAQGFNPQVNRDGEQFFNQGGQVLPEEIYGQDAIRQNMQLRMDRHNENPDKDYIIPDKPSTARVAADAMIGVLPKLARNAGHYWSEDNARFEKTNPNFGQRMDRALMPHTGFGSALGGWHDAVYAGSKADMALAATQAIPAFAALKTVKALPLKNTFQGNPFNQSATRAVADASRTYGVIGASGISGASIDEYQAARDGNDNNFADGGMVKSNRGFSPNIGKNGEQFFNQGGQVLDEEEAKRKAARTPGLAPAGIALTPEMANANRLAQQRQAGAQAIEQTKQNIGNKLDAAGNVIGQAYKGVTNAATVVPRTAYGVATGEIPVKFNSEARHPGADIVDGYKARDAKENASKWVNENPEQAKAAGLGMQGIADRATKPLIASMSSPQPALPQQRPLQDIGGAPMLLPQQSPTQTQQAEIDPATGQPVADQGAVTQLSNDLANTGKPDPVTGFVERTDQERRDFARSNKVNGVPMLDSRMAKTIDPNSINTMSSKGMTGLLGSQSSEAVSQALKAAADRGDWDAVNRHYQSQGQGFAGMGAPGQGQGTRVTVVRDPTRAPSNAEIMQQRLESARLRNADAGRRTDIEGQRVAAGIGNDQFRNQILDRQTDISSRGQDLAERQAEPTIAQQMHMQGLREKYYNLPEGPERDVIAKQIQDFSGKEAPLKDNFLIVGGGQEWDPKANAMRNIDRRAIDLRTGQEIGGNSGAQNHKPMPQGSTKESIISDAQKKIKAGVSKEAINNRLAEYGIDPL